MEEYEETKVKSLLLRGFTKEEICKLLSVKIDDLKDIKIDDDINKSSSALFTDLQKDLAKLVYKQMDTGDGTLVLNAIKLQAELQDKKLALSKSFSTATKVSRSLIKDRDKEIEELINKGISKKDVATKFNISETIIDRAIDRCSLNLPDDMWEGLEATTISETAGLDRALRLKVLEEAFKNNYSKRKVREVVTQIKNGK